MDVLVSGSERPPRPPLSELVRRRPSRAVVVAVAVALALVAGAGLAVLPVVEREAGRLSLRAEVVGATVALRGRGTDGVLRLRVSTTGRRAVTLEQVEARGADVRGRGTSPPAATVGPGREVVLGIRWAVPSCRRHDPAAGEVRIAARADDGDRGGLVVPVAQVLATGCGGPPAPGATVVGAQVVAGRSTVQDRTAAGAITVAVTSAGQPVRLVAVTAEVPGVLFVGPGMGPDEPVLAAGDRADVEVPFTIPFCPAVRPLGRVLVTVREPDGVLRQLGFSATADGEARVSRDVDLDVVLQACG